MLKFCGLNKQVLPEGLKAYAKFDDVSNILKDSAGGSNTDGAWEYSGSLPIYDSLNKKIGNGSAKFSTSANKAYLRTVDYKPPLQYNYPFTIEFFLREQYVYDNEPVLLRLYNGADSSIEYYAKWNPSRALMRLYVCGLGHQVTYNIDFSANYDSNSGAWNHFIIQYENGVIGAGCNGRMNFGDDFKRYYLWTDITPRINGRPLKVEFTNLTTDTWFDNIVIWDKAKYVWNSSYEVPFNGY